MTLLTESMILALVGADAVRNCCDSCELILQARLLLLLAHTGLELNKLLRVVCCVELILIKLFGGRGVLDIENMPVVIAATTVDDVLIVQIIDWGIIVRKPVLEKGVMAVQVTWKFPA